MALVTWDNKYAVGVKSLDGQHQVLFDILNELHGAMMKGQAQSVAGSLLRKLADYARTHFAAEESMMSAARYPGLAGHRIKHQDLTKQVQDYVARYERGEVSLSLQLLSFLRDWLTHHILETDREYGPWLSRNAVR